LRSASVTEWSVDVGFSTARPDEQGPTIATGRVHYRYGGCVGAGPKTNGGAYANASVGVGASVVVNGPPVKSRSFRIPWSKILDPTVSHVLDGPTT
jgi:hypothetical protein